MGFRNMYIAASAGSGKTYQLVNRFVALLSLQQLDRGRPEVGRLIAVTFTRKAAGEFKERILAALADAAQSEQKARDFWQERIWPTISDEQNGICPGAPMPELPPLRDFFTTMLRALTDAFSELKLSTLDSFFQQMVSTLAPELGLNSFSTLDNAQQATMNRSSLDLTYLHLSDRPLAELEGALNDCFADEADKNRPDNNLFRLVSEYHEAVLNAPDALWGGHADQMTDAQLALFGLTRSDVTPLMPEGEYLTTVEALRRTLPPTAGKNWHEFFISMSRLGSKLEPQPKKKEWAEWLRGNAIDLEPLVAARQPLYWRRLLARTRAICELIRAFERHYNRDVRSRGLYTFNDVLELLRQRADEECMLLMEERTDARLDHWMLDEFQDTSWSQYDILRDLLLNRASSSDGSIFMVGDAKQSIYQFRGGDPHIFLQARRELFGLQAGSRACEESAQMPLDTSYRSTQPVLDFANELFSHMETTARNACAPARQTWEKLGYMTHRAAPHMQKQAGCAAIYRVGPREAVLYAPHEVPELDGHKLANIFHALAAILAEKRPAGKAKVPGVAILADSHNHEVLLANMLTLLQPRYGFEGPIVICNDNEVGNDSPAGRALSRLFLWLNTPADEKSLSLLRLTPLWDALCNSFGTEADTIWQSLHQLMAAAGLSGTLNKLAQICPQLTANDFLRQRFMVWLNAADAFDATGGSLPEWLAAIEKLTVREEPQGNAIRIMTTHKAKGLEFDMVLLPLLDTKLMADSTHARLMQRRDEHGRAEAVLLKPTEDALVLNPAVREAVFTPWQAEQEFSSFCELYVAITRAKYATYVVMPRFSPPKSKKEPPAEYLILNRQVKGESLVGMMVQLAATADAADESQNLPTADCLYLRGDAHWERDWLERHPATQATAAAEPEEELNFHFPTLTRSTPSGRAAAARQHGSRAPMQFGERNRSGASFGTLVHHYFEQVGWLAEGELPELPEAHDDEEAQAQQAVLHALAEPAVHALFRRPAVPCRLFREQGIEALREGKSWVSGQLDRLVVQYEDATCRRATSAHIIDYKSDRCDAAALRHEYAPQMREYSEMVALAFHLPPEAVSVTLIHAPRTGTAAALPYAAGELE